MRHTDQDPSTGKSGFTGSAGGHTDWHKEGEKMTLAFDGVGGMRGRSRKVEVPFTESTDPSSVGVITAPLLYILIKTSNEWDHT